MASNNPDKMIHSNTQSCDKMLDPTEDCVSQGYKVSQDCKTEVLSLLQFPCDFGCTHKNYQPFLLIFLENKKTKANIFKRGCKWHFDGRKALTFLSVQQCSKPHGAW